MLKIKQYVKAESLEQAYELNQKKTNRIVGGMLWLKMSTAQIQTAIDLSGLGLDQIEETEDAWKIGCMVSLRDLELHEGLNELSCNMIRESVRSIVESCDDRRKYFRTVWIFGCTDLFPCTGYRSRTL